MRENVYKDIYKNTKTKVYPDGGMSTVYVNKPCFKDPLGEYYHEYEIQREYEKDCEMFGVSELETDSETDSETESEIEFETESLPKAEKSERERKDSLKRAKDKIFDIVRLNHWDYFITCTFDINLVDSADVQAVKKKLIPWLNHQVQRKGFKYIIVPEAHKSGRIHLHGFGNDALTYVDSGTVRCAGVKMPVKRETAEKKGLKVLSPVYNIKDWKFGFTTAIPTDNNIAFAYYTTKYITKDSNNIFGKYYYSGGDIVREPLIIYSNTDFDSVPKNAIRKPHTALQYKYQSNFNVPNWQEEFDKFDDFGALLSHIYSLEYRESVEKEF